MRRRIGIVSAGWNDEYQKSILAGITAASEEYNFDTLSFTSSNIDFSSEESNKCGYNIFNLLNDEYMDGLILAINTIFYKDVIEKVLERVAQMDIPVVGIDYEQDGMMSVGTDNYASARLMVEHLFEGDERSRFACITGVEFNPESDARVKAFKDVVTERMGGFAEEYIYTGDFQYAYGRRAADYWHDSEKEYPDAVFCCNDMMAIGFQERTLELGYRVPEDVKIVGYDNIIWGQSQAIPISSLQCAREEVGRKAVEMLKDVFVGEEPAQIQKIIGTPFFRASSGVINQNTTEALLDYYQNAAAQTRNDGSSLYLSNLLIERFAFCNSIDDFLKHLQRIVHQFPCEELYLCFTREQMHAMGYSFDVEESERYGYMLEKYSSYMYMLVHCENRQFYEPQLYETRKMLPILDASKDKRVDYVFLPLYFMGKTHGYCVLGNSHEVAYTGAFQTWTALFSYVVNNIYLKHELELRAQKLEYLYERDNMTGIYNRLGFKKHAKEMLHTCIGHDAQMMTLFADMDGLKTINDKFGHEEGDVAICAFTDILKKNCKHGEIVARFGGDEMVVLGIDYTKELAEDFVNRFQRGLEVYNANAISKPYKLSVSVGYVVYTPDLDTDIEEYVDKADAKMYRAKRRRKRMRGNK